ncbi:MAG: tetratricopeptide repeat protein, partial [Nitrospinota bacterium]
SPQRLQLRVLTLPTEEAAREALLLIREGKSFALLARERSMGPNVERGGYIGEVKLSELKPRVREALRGLKLGEVGGPVKTEEGFSLLQRTTNRFYNKGIELLREGDAAAARAELLEDLKLNPDNFNGWLALGIALTRLELYEGALRAYKNAIGLEPEEEAPYNNLGNLYNRLGRLELSIGMYKEALRRNPEQDVTLSNLAWLLGTRMGDPRGGILYMDRAIAVSPETAFYYDMRAQLYLMAGMPEKAREDWRQAIELEPENPLYRKRLLKPELVSPLPSSHGARDVGGRLRAEAETLTKKKEEALLEEHLSKPRAEGASPVARAPVREPSPSPSSEPLLRIKVLNGNGREGSAQQVAGLLEKGGFPVERIDNASSFDYERTAIYYKARARGAAEEIPRLLGLRAELKALSWPSDFDLIVIVGKDL